MTQPHAGEWFPLDAEHVHTAYLKEKAARLCGNPADVQLLESISSATVKVYLVRGNTRMYRVWLCPNTSPWVAACSRYGIHDLLPDGVACSHGLAAAVAWELAREEARA